MTVFDDALADFFADPNMAEDVLYTPSAGPPAMVRASFSAADEQKSWGSGAFIGTRVQASIRAAELLFPAAGDMIERADGSLYQVQSWLTDALRLSHDIVLAPQ